MSILKLNYEREGKGRITDRDVYLKQKEKKKKLIRIHLLTQLDNNKFKILPYMN